MLKKHSAVTRTATHRRQMLAREALLLAAVVFIALMLQAGGHRVSVLALDGTLICAGVISTAAVLMSHIRIARWWFIGISVTAAFAGAVQLFWSSGFALGFVALVAILLVGDGLANIVILGGLVWQGSRNDHHSH